GQGDGAVQGPRRGRDDQSHRPRGAGSVGVKSGEHALTVLEFSRVLDLVAGHASSAPGATRTRELHPLENAHEVASEHARVEAMRAIVGSESGWSAEAIPDLAGALNRLRVEGAAWTALE